MTYYFLNTCEACPEQYEVWNEYGEHVAYVRLRWGKLCVYPNASYEKPFMEVDFENKLKGKFDDVNEKDLYLFLISSRLLRLSGVSKDVHRLSFYDFKSPKTLEEILGIKIDLSKYY